MQVLFNCPSCQQTSRTDIEVPLPAESSARFHCGNCAWNRAYRPQDLENGQPRQCLICGCQDLWRQKDFPQQLGLAMVAMGAISSTIFWMYYMPVPAIGVLLFFALIDMCLYLWMPDVLVCYRCHARHRQTAIEENFPRFNLETAERYRQEAIRLELAGCAEPAAPPSSGKAPGKQGVPDSPETPSAQLSRPENLTPT